MPTRRSMTRWSDPCASGPERCQRTPPPEKSGTFAGPCMTSESVNEAIVEAISEAFVGPVTVEGVDRIGALLSAPVFYLVRDITFFQVIETVEDALHAAEWDAVEAIPSAETQQNTPSYSAVAAAVPGQVEVDIYDATDWTLLRSVDTFNSIEFDVEGATAEAVHRDVDSPFSLAEFLRIVQ